MLPTQFMNTIYHTQVHTCHNIEYTLSNYGGCVLFMNNLRMIPDLPTIIGCHCLDLDTLHVPPCMQMSVQLAVVYLTAYMVEQIRTGQWVIV